MTLWTSLRRLFRRRSLERELDAELRDHIEREVAAGVRAGHSEADMRRQIRLTSGGLDQVKEACRDVRPSHVFADLSADVRFAWRMLAKDRWFTAGAILTLALAMGVANATFITTYATLWRDLPFERPDRVAIMRTLDGRGREGGVSYPDFEDWRRNAHVFDGMAAAMTSGTMSLGRDGGIPQQFDGLYVSADTFSVLRVKPVLGRDFSPADDRPGAEAVVIIGSNIWKGRYGASREVLGRSVSVNGSTRATIIGVMPDGFRFIDSTDLWMPLADMPTLTRQHRDARSLFMIGRLPDGSSLSAVRAELSRIAANLASTYPETNTDVRPLVNSLWEAYNGGMTVAENPLPLLAAVFVLLIASANLANLLLARGVYRSHEIAIRFALGATRSRIVRQLLIESLLLALVAWVLAVAGSWLALNVSMARFDMLPYWRLKMDVRLLGLLAGVAAITTALFGLAPAIYASRRGSADGLKDSGRMSASPKSRRWILALLVGQFAITLALLNGAGLTAKVFYTLSAIDRKVQTSDAMTTFIRLPPQKYATPAQRVAFHDDLRARLIALPGITASTIASAPPFYGATRRGLLEVDGRPVSNPPPNITTLVVGPDYFRLLVGGLTLGEPFSESDGTPGHATAIVNQRFADVYLGPGNPVGRHLELRAPPQPRTPNESARAIDNASNQTPLIPLTIIGVSPDIRQDRLDASPIVYLPFRAEAPAGVTLIVRGSGGTARLAAAARNAANSIDPDLALGGVRTLEELRTRSSWLSKDLASQFAEIGGLALLFSGIGLYSAMAYALRRRTHEIAIRMTLGAPSRHVRWLFLRMGAWVVGGGLVLGVPASLAGSRLMQNNIVNGGPTDFLMLAALVVLLMTVALVACIVPARRATRLQPTIALRIE
jgi:putative ABC transport system permease protein